MNLFRVLPSIKSLRMLVGACLLLSLFVGIGGLAHGKKLSDSAAPVYLVNMDAVINPGTAALLEHAIETAEAHSAAALILRINTPGGLLSSTRDMVRAISDSKVPVIGYVGPAGASATSAGAFILLSTHLAVMNSGTNVGAASPVAGDGGEIQGTMAKKIMSDTRAFMRGIAKHRNRNADIAERFVSEAESLSADEALEANVVDLVVPGFSDLIKAVDGREIQFQGQLLILALSDKEIRQITPRFIDHILNLVAHPQIAHMLISVGLLAIFIEMLAPGLTLPGILGTIALVLGLVGMQALPVNLGFLLLLLFGIALMIAEYFVAGFGVLGIGGAIAFVLGSLNLFDGPIPANQSNTILSVSIAVSAAMLLATLLITGSFIFGSRKKGLKGKVGEAMVDFDSNGYVLIDQQRFSADTLEPLRHGDRIEVVKIDRNDRLLVKKARKNLPGTIDESVDEAKQTVAESRSMIRRIEQAGNRIHNHEFKSRIERICRVADSILSEIEADPRDIRKARKFLNVYLDGAMQVTEGYAKTHSHIQSGQLTQNFRNVLETIEATFLEQQQKLFEDDLFDLDVKIEVLNAQLKREGIR
ncbi:MAG: hypothetical protein CVV06_00430 [Gammaproteobacteria bacterium HGW-Gammaproteobacteria-10]|nr:MAG: hypothetical protein CVV06_00430 [Gammaproteobacteria bacterium HGW-Gammaproteobacteria-10]